MLRVSRVILAKNLPSWLHLWRKAVSGCTNEHGKATGRPGLKSTHLKMGQWAELSQWKPLFLCPVRMSQIMMAWGSSWVSISGLKVTRYLQERGHLAQHFLWYESHIASTHYCGSQTQVLRPLPKCREPASPPYTMIPKNGIWSLQVGGGASTTRYKVITDPYKSPRMGLPHRSGTRKSNTPTSLLEWAGLEGRVVWILPSSLV